jgi:eukaryotic-like serine/threonine-protein kinase
VEAITGPRSGVHRSDLRGERRLTGVNRHDLPPLDSDDLPLPSRSVSEQDGVAGRRLARRYLLVAVLGSGGMGTVWRARDELLDRDVAVKELNTPPHLDEAERVEANARAVREARAAAQLRHPAIVVVHDAFLEDGRPWIVMQLLNGAPLDSVLARNGVLAPARAARLGLDVLGALGTAHAAGVLHRDVKPGNIFLTADGRAVLTDFGIASVEGQATITRSGMLIGSPGHIAPERLSGERPGPQSDLWSLAATLYEAVEGHRPFRGDNPLSSLTSVLTQDPEPPVRAGALGPLLVGMLARDPTFRPAPDTVRAVLERVAAGESAEGVRLPPPAPAAPAPPTSVDPISPAPARRIALLPAVAAGGAALLALAATVLVATGGPTPVATAAATSATSTTSTPTAAAAPTNAPRFTAPIDFCALVPAADVRRINPGYTGSEGTAGGGGDDPSCAWDAPGAGIEVKVVKAFSAESPWVTTPEDAHDRYRQGRQQATGSDKVIWHYDGIGGESITSGPRTAGEDVPDVGEEAFVTDTYGRRGAQLTEVVFRVDNVVVEVTYADVTDRTGRAEIRQRAVRMAHRVVDALAAS